MSFKDLEIKQGTGLNFRDTIITTNGKLIAILTNTPASLITENDFVQIDSLTGLPTTTTTGTTTTPSTTTTGTTTTPSTTTTGTTTTPSTTTTGTTTTPKTTTTGTTTTPSTTTTGTTTTGTTTTPSTTTTGTTTTPSTTTTGTTTTGTTTASTISSGIQQRLGADVGIVGNLPNQNVFDLSPWNSRPPFWPSGNFPPSGF
ncbi:MAG: hypothetical protein ACRCT1_20445 [Microcoleaceae cyanobacterium]